MANDQARGHIDEQTPLLPQPASPETQSQHEATAAQRQQTQVARRLYISHFLSTWNARVFEFGAVLYLASIFPGTLLPMSAYALVRGLAALALAPLVGRYIDTGDRLQVVRVSIVYQRLATAVSCVVFYLLTVDVEAIGSKGKQGMLALVIFLACVERLCAMMNLVAVEKDWVVVVAQNDEEILSLLNSQMRRIDLLCKLLGPLFIALIDGWATRIAILANFAMNLASVPVEYFAIAQVYHRVPALQEAKQTADSGAEEEAATERETEPEAGNWLLHAWNSTKTVLDRAASDFSFHLHHRAFLPSMAGALLYCTVLTFSGQMVTYLIAAGYTSSHIGVARAACVTLEVMATWVAPWLMRRVGPIRAGLWASTFEFGSLAVGTAVFWAMMEPRPLVSAGGLVVGTMLSRVGLWAFVLSIQAIVQEEVEPDRRGAFSAAEAAWQNAFELLVYVSTMVLHRPEQFRWPALMSVVAVGSASATYALFVRQRRGHLLHLEHIAALCKTGRSG